MSRSQEIENIANALEAQVRELSISYGSMAEQIVVAEALRRLNTEPDNPYNKQRNGSSTNGTEKTK